jgi:GAF domain-containing protein
VDNDPIPHVAVSPLGRAKLDELLQEVLQRIDEVVATHERLGGLLDAVVSLVGDLDLDSVLQRIVTVAGQLAGAKYVALGVLGAGPDRRLREFVTYGLPDEERTLIGDLPRGHGILGVLIDRPEPLRLNRIQHHPASYGFPAGHPPMGTFLGTPIRIRDKVFGNLYLTEKQMPGGFTEQDEELVVALAAAAGVVIENARLHEEAARRQRWLCMSRGCSRTRRSWPCSRTGTASGATCTTWSSNDCSASAWRWKAPTCRTRWHCAGDCPRR